MPSSRGYRFVADGIYHVLSRGVERRSIFANNREYERFSMLLEYYRVNKPPLSFSHFLALPVSQREIYRQSLAKRALLADIVAYCLMPNHYHLIVRQKQENGVVRMLSNVSNGYAKYFNTKRNRVGPLFQGPFKAIRIETDEQLMHLSRYVHINPFVSGTEKNWKKSNIWRLKRKRFKAKLPGGLKTQVTVRVLASTGGTDGTDGPAGRAEWFGDRKGRASARPA